ncbi:MAG: hypothetical protein NDI69_04775 [Bacteriovoracaceae bacterium]|nr:hypothetical protein [Bacteriovoracaceae bacterium]
MKNILLLCLLVSFPTLAAANAVEALKNYIPLYDHHGVNDAGLKCSVDFYRRLGGAVMVEMLAPRVNKFLVEPQLSFGASDKSFKVSRPSFEENDGIVTMSLIFENSSAIIERKFCVEEQCWNSRTVCHLDRW